MTAAELRAKLAAHFPADAISWRVGSTTADKSKGLALAYIDSRDVQGRLDDVVGIDCWQDEYFETASGILICRLSIKVDGQWVTKSDGAGKTDVEAEKGQVSDAFKRAAVKWGIGRYLYSLDSPWVELEKGRHIAKHELPRLRALLTRNGAEPTAPVARQPAPEPQGAPSKPSYIPTPTKEPVTARDPKTLALEHKAEQERKAAEFKAKSAKLADDWCAELASRYEQIQSASDRAEVFEQQTRYNSWYEMAKVCWKQLTPDDRARVQKAQRRVADLLKAGEVKAA